ncbi:protein ovarian tumor locus isoform X1 [Daktulosphaira vitifoliae]|uniref:protein ovarian tumor locus isoform X1 n=1 Tax=Daktulosphaira vitifoliae TaxID=58002 RepID=UPI0021AAC083|nr:protein ovarian tumor locus isoform X1 [Daktulosphaira vitifoliae]
MLTLSIRNRSKSKRTPTPKIDELLESIGLMRHVVPRDGSSLFRCISQCVFLTQSCHMTVRQNLLLFSKLQIKEFSKMTQMSPSKYAKKIIDTKVDGELLDMRIAAKFYRINIAFYLDAQPFVPLIVETPDAVKTLSICLNYEGTYDLVLTKESVENISVCQSIMYEMLYKNVFNLSSVDFAVKEMLFERKYPSSRSNDRASLEKRATCTDMKELLENGITPFPFKVAKALTPKLYRNTEYDIWLNSKKEKFYGRWNNWEFKEGSKCLVMIGNEEYDCYIQRIREKNEPVEVYVKDLAQKIDVEFEQLKLMPVDQEVRNSISSPPVQVSHVSSTSNECCKPTVDATEKHCESPRYQHQTTTRPNRQQTTPDSPRYTAAILPSPNYYLPQYPPPVLPLNNLNPTNSGSVMHPWYMSTPPPPPTVMQPSFKDRFIMVEPSPLNLNKNRITPPNIQFVNYVEGSPRMSAPPPPPPHFQQVSPSWYCVSEHQTDTTCKCTQCNNNEESAVTVDFNRAYQPWPVQPEFDVPSSELQH